MFLRREEFFYSIRKRRERERGEDKQAFKTVFHFPLINFPRKYFPVGFHSKEKKVIIIITKTIASKILKTLLVILSFLSKKSVIDQKRNVNSWRMFRDEEDRSMTINSKNRLMSPRVKKLINYSFIQVSLPSMGIEFKGWKINKLETRRFEDRTNVFNRVSRQSVAIIATIATTMLPVTLFLFFHSRHDSRGIIKNGRGCEPLRELDNGGLCSSLCVSAIENNARLRPPCILPSCIIAACKRSR